MTTMSGRTHSDGDEEQCSTKEPHTHSSFLLFLLLNNNRYHYYRNCHRTGNFLWHRSHT